MHDSLFFVTWIHIFKNEKIKKNEENNKLHEYKWI